MPAYELALIVRANMLRPQLTNAIKRCCETIINHGGYVRKFENLGERRLPYKMHAHGKGHTHGQYFIVNFDSSSDKIITLRTIFAEDKDLVRPSILNQMETFIRPCDFKQCEFEENKDFEKDRKVWKKKSQRFVTRPKKKL